MNRTSIRQAVILAGGKGTRLHPITETVPKPMVDVHGKPFLSYLIQQLVEQGLEEVIILTGYRGEQIQEYFGAGEDFGISIRYSHGLEEWETAYRIYQARELLEERFLLLYGDNFTVYSLKLLEQFASERDVAISLVASEKANGNIAIESDGRVACYDPERKGKNLEYVEIGFMIVVRDALLSCIDSDSNQSLSEFLEKFANESDLAAYILHHPYYSVGDLERLEGTREYLHDKKILLLDRDGTLCVKADRGSYITSVADFKLLDGVIEGLRLLQEEGFEFVIITNQAGIATGDLSRQQLQDIHAHMLEQFEQNGLSIREIICCFDHWQDHDSWRRKPNPGMLLEASAKHSLRLDKTFYVGDDIRDMIAASRAGSRGIYLGDQKDLLDLQEFEKPVACFTNMVDVARYIVGTQ